MSDQPAWLRMLSASITGRENLATVISYTSIVSLGGHLLFIGLFLWAGVWPMAVFNVGSSLLFLICY